MSPIACESTNCLPSQGLELDEGDTNPFANSDGFYPVSAHRSAFRLA